MTWAERKAQKLASWAISHGTRIIVERAIKDTIEECARVCDDEIAQAARADGSESGEFYASRIHFLMTSDEPEGERG